MTRLRGRPACEPGGRVIVEEADEVEIEVVAPERSRTWISNQPVSGTWQEPSSPACTQAGTTSGR